MSVTLLFQLSCSGPPEYEPSFTWSPIEINAEIKGSDKVEAVIAPYRAKLDSIMDEVIGYASHDLTTQGAYESTLGTFVTRLLLEQSISSFDTAVDVAIMNHHGGLRAPINQGDITLGEVFEVMPFENEMILLELSGDVLLETIHFIGKSRRSMIWPVSFQVTEKGAKNVRVNGEEIVPDKKYVLSISDYLANGGGGFQLLKPQKRLDVKPVKLRDFIVKEIKQQTARGDSIKAQVANAVTLLTP
ncbi:MAG: 5'-nucleotidase [Bacteroidota bacterium]